MKKALATIMGLAFAVSAMAQYLIYDYNVSFKRIDAQFTKVTYQFGSYDGKKKDFTGYFDSFKTASDKLTGYVIIPACKDCNGAWEEFGSATYTVAESDASSAFVPEEKNTDGYVVVTRNGDNLAKNPYLAAAGYADFTGKVVWILQAHLDAAMFGQGAAVRLAAKDEADDCSDAIYEVADYEGTVTSLKAAKEAWLVLTYDVPVLKDEDEEEVMVYPPVKGLAINDDCIEPIHYGFLGYLCLNGNVSNAGFGTVTTTTTKGSTTVGFCGTKVVDGASCIAVNSISGSTIGYFKYEGFCSNPALFDICTKKATKEYAPMAGTFTFKLNSSLSKKYGADIDTIKGYIEDVKYKNDTFATTGIEFAEAEGGDDSDDDSDDTGDDTTEP